MKFEINGVTYDPILGLQKVTLQTLFELKVKHGVSVKDLQVAAVQMDKIKDPIEILENTEYFQTFMIIIWLARRYAGEKMTLEQANDDFGIADLKLITEDGDEAKAAPDPKVRAASVRDAKRHKAKRPSASRT